MIIAIDGPAGSGKSSTAKALAKKLGVLHLDTGAMYRAVTLKCLRQGVRDDDDEALDALVRGTSLSFTGSAPDVRIWMDGEDVTEAVRGDNVTRHVSDYCKPAVVRERLVAQQREIGAGQSVVCEGRDIGTVVFPDADVKFYMVASVEERARRRQRDFAAIGVTKSIPELMEEIEARDRKDSTRANSPLRKAEDAEEVDTTGMTFEAQVEYLARRVPEKTAGGRR